MRERGGGERGVSGERREGGAELVVALPRTLGPARTRTHRPPRFSALYNDRKKQIKRRCGMWLLSTL